VDPELAGKLAAASDTALRRVAEAVARHAVRSTGLVDARLEAAMAAVGLGKGHATARDAMEVLTHELDEVAWEKQSGAEEAASQDPAYLRAFMRARAANAVAFALEADALVAATESTCEALQATEDPEQVRSAVLAALESPGTSNT
jgi:hypothetical protein